MSEFSIKVEGVSKKYTINHNSRRTDSFREAVMGGVRKIVGSVSPWAASQRAPRSEEFYALRDVNFSIEQGDKVGIIGRNGAGKSTLLKVLSRITEPSSGKITVNGRIASLLEVGTGFHPELTGRENIYLNGAILGMRRAEIARKFDEIVEFAEVSKFLDTPVKRYSSGMYVRLAFSVAAHLEPEILVVDEVLAVGDVEFQKKCLGKMGEVSKAGRTILFVSHNMNAIEQLCSRAILLKEGTVVENSTSVRKVIQDYLKGDGAESGSEWSNIDNGFAAPEFQLNYACISDSGGTPLVAPCRNDETIRVEIEGEVTNLDNALQVGYALYDEENNLLYWSIFNDARESDWPKVRLGKNRFVSTFPRRMLNEGRYRVEIIVALYFRAWIVEPQKNSPALHFTIQGGLSDSPYWMMRRPGVFAPEISWELQ